MNRQSTRRAAGRGAARTLALAAMVALIATLSAGPALASATQADERVLERQGMIRRQADEQGKATEPAQAPSAQYPRRYLRPEPPIHTGPRLDGGQQVPPGEVPVAPADSRTGLVVALAVGALLLAVGAARTAGMTTGPYTRTGSRTPPATPSTPTRAKRWRDRRDGACFDLTTQGGTQPDANGQRPPDGLPHARTRGRRGGLPQPAAGRR